MPTGHNMAENTWPAKQLVIWLEFGSIACILCPAKWGPRLFTNRPNSTILANNNSPRLRHSVENHLFAVLRSIPMREGIFIWTNGTQRKVINWDSESYGNFSFRQMNFILMRLQFLIDFKNFKKSYPTIVHFWVKLCRNLCYRLLPACRIGPSLYCWVNVQECIFERIFAPCCSGAVVATSAPARSVSEWMDVTHTGKRSSNYQTPCECCCCCCCNRALFA